MRLAQPSVVERQSLSVTIPPLVPPRPGQSKALLDELLAGHDPVAVEAAIARLAIAGRTSLRQVLQRLDAAEAAHLPRLLRVLERIADPSALPAVTPLLAHPTQEIALAAVDAVGALLDARAASVASSALDALTTTLLDRDADDAVRLRAYEAIANAPDPSESYDADVLAPLRTQLRQDSSAALRAAVNGDAADATPSAPEPAGEAQLDAAADALPTDPEHLRRLLGAHGAEAPLTRLHRLIERVRGHEASLGPEDVEAWRVVRATAHQVLAARGSRVALYDIRETLESLGAQTPVGMLSALQQVGDVSVLDAVADAFSASDDAWFRGQLAGVFRAIVGREKLTKRQATIKKIAARHPEAFERLWINA